MNPVRPQREFYYTYVLQSQQSWRWYTGATADLRNRFAQHRDGLVRSTRGDNYSSCITRPAVAGKPRFGENDISRVEWASVI